MSDDMDRVNRATEALAAAARARQEEALAGLESLLALIGDLSPAEAMAADKMRLGIRRETAKYPIASDALADPDLGPDWFDRLTGGH